MTETFEIDDTERRVYLESVLDEMLLKIQIHLNKRGYGTKEILAALDNVCAKRWEGYEENPDPAENP